MIRHITVEAVEPGRLWLALGLAALVILVDCAAGHKNDPVPTPVDWQLKSAEVALANPDPEVVADAITMLGNVKAQTSLPLVLAGYQKYRANKLVSASTARYLGQARDSPETSLPVLAGMLDDDEQSVVDASVASIGEYGEAATVLVPQLVSLHKKGSITQENGFLVEHPPTSSALSKIGLRQQDDVNGVLDSASKHGPEVFAGIQGNDLKKYAVSRLLTMLSGVKEDYSRYQILEALQFIEVGTPDEYKEVRWILDQDPSPATIVAQGKAALLLGRTVQADPKRAAKPIVERLLVLARAYEDISKANDQKPLQPWEKSRLNRVLLGEQANPFISALGEIARTDPDLAERFPPMFNCDAGDNFSVLQSIAVLQALTVAGKGGLRVQQMLVDCVQNHDNPYVLEFAPAALTVNKKLGGDAIEELATAISRVKDEAQRLKITGTLLATDEYLPPDLDQPDLLTRTRAAAKWLRSGSQKSKAFLVLNSCLRDGIARATKHDLSNQDCVHAAMDSRHLGLPRFWREPTR
jgi:hypothetical protein